MNDRLTTESQAIAPVLDWAHLARQTMGNAALQREVLMLFDEHAARVLAEIKGAAGAAGRREAAHALVGSARGIGAFAVARAASAIEAETHDSEAGIDMLEAAIAAARRAIAEHLSE
ncbi:MAG: hypothetical protein ABI399_03605 [Bauldia sp.]